MGQISQASSCDADRPPSAGAGSWRAFRQQEPLTKAHPGEPGAPPGPASQFSHVTASDQRGHRQAPGDNEGTRSRGESPLFSHPPGLAVSAPFMKWLPGSKRNELFKGL